MVWIVPILTARSLAFYIPCLEKHGSLCNWRFQMKSLLAWETLVTSAFLGLTSVLPSTMKKRRRMFPNQVDQASTTLCR
jgi:hypothetical protein